MLDVNILIKGHYRTFDKTYPSFKKSLNGLTYKYSLHTWNTINVDSTPLTSEQIVLLKSFDPNIIIEEQDWLEEESKKLWTNLSFKIFKNYWYGIQSCINRISEESKYIIITRYDILLNTEFKNFHCDENEIIIGHRYDKKYFLSSAATDIIFFINYKDKDKFAKMPKEYLDWEQDPSKYKYTEDAMNDFISSNWKKIRIQWIYTKDYNLLR